MQRYLLNTVGDLARATKTKSAAAPAVTAGAATGKPAAKAPAKLPPRAPSKPLRPGSKLTLPPPLPRNSVGTAPVPKPVANAAKPAPAATARPAAAPVRTAPSAASIFGPPKPPVAQTAEAKALAAKAAATATNTAPDAQVFSTKAADLQRLSMQVLAESGLPAPPNRVKQAVTRAAGAYGTHEDLLDMLAHVQPLEEPLPEPEPEPVPVAKAKSQTFTIPKSGALKSPSKPLRPPPSMKPLTPMTRRPG